VTRDELSFVCQSECLRAYCLTGICQAAVVLSRLMAHLFTSNILNDVIRTTAIFSIFLFKAARFVWLQRELRAVKFCADFVNLYLFYVQLIKRLKLDVCIVWNAHNTVFGSKSSAISAQAVYFLYSTMPSVTFLRLSDVSVICRVTYFQFPIQACFYSTLLLQASQLWTWFTQYRPSDVVENLGRFLVRSVQTRKMTLIIW